MASKLLKNQLFIILMNGVFAYTAFCAVIISTLNVPPEAILDSNLKQVLMVFEDIDEEDWDYSDRSQDSARYVNLSKSSY